MQPMMSGDAELKVTFFPPLYLQRRIWVLDILRREHVSEVSTSCLVKVDRAVWLISLLDRGHRMWGG